MAITNAKKIRLMVVDDHIVVRHGIISIMKEEADIEVVAEAGDGIEAEMLALQSKPDVILIDISMPHQNGFITLSHIRQKLPETRALIITASDKEQDLFEALRLGACGYVLKNESIDSIVSAVRHTAAGESVISPSLATRLVDQFRLTTGAAKLSHREEEILRLIAEELSSTEISRRLFLGESTVRTYISRIMDKLHLQNRVSLTIYAAKHYSQ